MAAHLERVSSGRNDISRLVVTHPGPRCPHCHPAIEDYKFTFNFCKILHWKGDILLPLCLTESMKGIWQTCTVIGLTTDYSIILS